MLDFRATENSSLKCVVPAIRKCSENDGDMSIGHRNLLDPVPTRQFGNDFSININNNSSGL